MRDYSFSTSIGLSPKPHHLNLGVDPLVTSTNLQHKRQIHNIYVYDNTYDKTIHIVHSGRYTYRIYAKTLTEGMGASGGPHPGSHALPRKLVRHSKKSGNESHSLFVWAFDFVRWTGSTYLLRSPGPPFRIQMTHRSCHCRF